MVELNLPLIIILVAYTAAHLYAESFWWQQLSSVQDSIYTLRQYHTRSFPSLRILPPPPLHVAGKTVPLLV